MNVPFPTSGSARPFYFQNSRLYQSVPAPCRVIFGGHSYHARIHHAEVGHQNKPFSGRRNNHVHPVYHIIITTGGSGHFRLDESLMPVERRTLVITGPGEPHCFERVAGETTRYAEVTFDFTDERGRVLEVPFQKMLSLWSGLQSRCGRLQQISEQATAGLEQAIEHLVRVGLSPASELMFFRLSTALNRILEHCCMVTLEPQAATMPWEKARHILLEDYTRLVSIGELSERVGVHRDYLARRFRKAFGTTPLAFQNQLRIDAAKTWLISTDYTLKEIAARIGFDDPGYFARIFRRKMKISPGEFRRSRRAK